MTEISSEQIKKIFELANLPVPEQITGRDINNALVELEKSLSTCSVHLSELKSNKNVLIVDDLEITLHQLTKLLNKSGFNAYVARNIEEAKHNITIYDYDYIFVDLFMPQPENGFDLIKMIKKNPKCVDNNTKTAVISGTEDQKLISECLKCGANEFIHKSQNWHKNLLRFLKSTENTKQSSNDDYVINHDYSENKLLHIIIKKFHLKNTILELQKEVIGFANSGFENIILDFSNITTITPEMAELIAHCYSKAYETNIKLSLCSVSNEIYSQLVYVFLTDVIKIYGNIEEAVSDLVNATR